MIIAVDFDGTLCENCYPEIGAVNERLVQALKAQREKGDRLILWTCRSGEHLQAAVEWCQGFELQFDAINDNLPEVVSRYGNNSRKITADYYIDDRSMKPWEDFFQVS